MAKEPMALKDLRQFMTTETPLKMMNNAFIFY